MKLLIVESNGLFRETFVRRFQGEDGIEVVGQMDHIDPVELPAEVEVLEPDIILMGVGVADSDTLAAINRVLAGHRHPGVVLHGRSLTLPAAIKVADILRTIDRGFAYIDSDRIDSVDSLVAIARVVADGKVVIDPVTTQRLLNLINTHVQAMGLLTADERELLAMLARGETDEAAAEALHIGPSMVSAKVIDIAGKFGVDGTSRDARVTTILRYLVATGALPMDYDTGTVLSTPFRPTLERAAGPGSAPQPHAKHTPKAHSKPAEQEVVVERPEEPRQEAAQVEEQPGRTEPLVTPEVSVEAPEPKRFRNSDDVVYDVFPGAQPDVEPATQPEEVETPNPDVAFHYGQEGVDEFAQFSHLGKPEDVEVALRVLEWAANRGLRVRWGTRSSGGSFALVLDSGNLSFWLLTVWAIGTVEVQFAMMLAQPPFSDVERRRDLANRLNLIEGVRIDEIALGGRPRVPLASLRDQEDWELFTSAMDWALHEIRSFVQPSQQRKDAAN